MEQYRLIEIVTGINFSVLISGTHDTYLLIEFTNANKCPPEDMLGFEAEAREEMQKIVPSCYPMVVSCLQHKENSFKPGSFLKPNSKLFVSRFNSQTDVAAVWNSGKLLTLRRMLQRF